MTNLKDKRHISDSDLAAYLELTRGQDGFALLDCGFEIAFSIGQIPLITLSTETETLQRTVNTNQRQVLQVFIPRTVLTLPPNKKSLLVTYRCALLVQGLIIKDESWNGSFTIVSS